MHENIENKLEAGCEICNDLMDCHDADEEDLFFEVINEEAVRKNLQKNHLRKLLKQWGDVETNLFRTIA